MTSRIAAVGSQENYLADFETVSARRETVLNTVLTTSKRRMNAIEVSDDDLIYLNVGGQKLATTRSTLCQVEGSLIASMFNGHWDSNHKRDKDGAVFLDYNPQYFVAILNYLRAKTFATPKYPSLPRVPEAQIKDFKNFVQYLGLSNEIFPTEKFNLHSTGVSLEEDGKVAAHGTGTVPRYVLGEIVYHQRNMNIKLTFESFYRNYWMFVGIAKGDVVPWPLDNSSHKWRGSYGWGLGRDGEVWKDGSGTHDAALDGLTGEGDTVELVLDCDAGKLSLHLSTGQQFHIEIPKSQTWRLHVNFEGEHDKIRIMNE